VPVHCWLRGGRPLIGGEKTDALLLGCVSTGVAKHQSVEFNRRCARELSEVASGMLQKQRTVTLLVALHRILPPKESMKRSVENHRLKEHIGSQGYPAPEHHGEAYVHNATTNRVYSSLRRPHDSVSGLARVVWARKN
jgi:hypothetical protein